MIFCVLLHTKLLYYDTRNHRYFLNTFLLLFSHSSPVPPLRTMFSNKSSCFVSLVLLSVVCRQAQGYTRRSSGQKYLVKTGNNSPAKHLLVETEDADYDPEEYDSAEGNIIY